MDKSKTRYTQLLYVVGEGITSTFKTEALDCQIYSNTHYATSLNSRKDYTLIRQSV